MKVQDVMSGDVACLARGDTLQTAAAKMAEINVGSLPVTDGGKLVGVVTDRDMVTRCIATGAGADTPVESAMTGDVVTVSPDCSIEEASQLMSDRQIRRIYVVDGDAVTGVVSLGDLALEAPSSDPGDALREISKR